MEAEPFVTAIEALAFARATLTNSSDKFSGMMDVKSRKQSRQFLQTVAQASSALNAKVTRGEALYMIAMLRGEKLKYEEFLGLLEGLSRILSRELGDAHLFALEEGRAIYFDQVSAVFGTDVVNAFPEAEYDLEEAAKSLAVSRNTACIFHLMRAMEVVVSAIGRKLDVTLFDRDDQALEWGRILANMSLPIEAMPKGGDRTKWSAAHSLLYHVKEAWRNPTMHPGSKYTDDEARQTLDAVRTFVRHLTPLVVTDGGLSEN